MTVRWKQRALTVAFGNCWGCNKCSQVLEWKNLQVCEGAVEPSEARPCFSEYHGSDLTCCSFFSCQHHGEGRESSAAAGQLQSPQHALSQRQASGQTRGPSLDVVMSLRGGPPLTCSSSSPSSSSHLEGGGGQERPVVPALHAALQNSDVWRSEECEWQLPSLSLNRLHSKGTEQS